jgi:hypothetical protein
MDQADPIFVVKGREFQRDRGTAQTQPLGIGIPGMIPVAHFEEESMGYLRAFGTSQFAEYAALSSLL